MEPQRRTVEDVLPNAAKRKGSNDLMISHAVLAECNDTDGCSRFERL